MNETIETALKELEKTQGFTDDYKVLRRIHTGAGFATVDPAQLKHALFLDFETTGLEATIDLPIEIGLVLVEFDGVTGALGRIVDEYSALEDPGIPLPEVVKRVTGITDESLVGQKFDDMAVNTLVARADIVIAHNAEFDRSFGERRFTSLVDKQWACSFEDIPWKDLGMGGRSLEYLLLRAGFFYAGHRAVVDAQATAHLMHQIVGDAGRRSMSYLLEASSRDVFRIYTPHALFDTKDDLKAAGYRWGDTPDFDKKSWAIETADLAGQLTFLAELLGKKNPVLVHQVGKLNRFTQRSEKSAWVKPVAGMAIEGLFAPAKPSRFGGLVGK